MKIVAKQNQLHITCHDEPITIFGKRYKKLMLSVADLWRMHDGQIIKNLYPERYELMIFKVRHGSVDWGGLHQVRSHIRYDLYGVLAELRKGSLHDY